MNETRPLDLEAERPPPPKRQMSAKIALVSCVVVVLLGGFAFWWFALRDTAPPRVETPVVTDSDIPVDAVVPESAEGEWTVHQTEKTFAGYRINETFAGETFTKTAVGRTTLVTGSMVISDDSIVATEIVADLTGLESTAENRDITQQDTGLEIVRFPTATFRLTEPVALGVTPGEGQVVTVLATGELTLHGVTRPIELELEGVWSGATITVSGHAPILLADYDIAPPETSLVGVEDHGEFEVSLVFLWKGPAPTPTSTTP
jgi:polyisoprenoid-binding protein YceI